MIDAQTLDLAADVLNRARARRVRLATAESCTGGLVAAALTAIAGSSDVFDRGWVVYANAAKEQILGVAPALLEAHGAVSEPVARALAEGALSASTADLAVSITGVAGPGGGSLEKPVGLVWFGLAERGRAPLAFERRFGDLGRTEVRREAVRAALAALAARLEVGQG